MTRPQSDTSLEQAVPDALRGYLDLPEVRTGFDRRARLIEVGQLIKDLRIAQGLTQAELAERVGTSQPEIVRLERGLGRQGPTIDTLMRVAGAMHKALRIGFVPEDQAGVSTGSPTEAEHCFLTLGIPPHKAKLGAREG